MVKKSPRDLYKDGLSRRAMMRRRGLRGPFRCPKCLFADKLHCQAKTQGVKEAFIKPSGKEGVRWRRETTYLFSCQNKTCGFRRVVVSPGESRVIDEYNAFYDRELSFVEAEAQRSYIRGYSIRLLRLSECKVSMK